MSDSQIVINSLQQSLNCAGKCDCCANLQQQINQLKQQVSNQSNFDGRVLFEKIKPFLLPAIAPIAIAAVSSKLQPLQIAQQALKADFAQLKPQVKLGLDLAKDASGKVITASNAAEFAKKQSSQAFNVASSVGGKLAPIANKADDAFFASSKALQQAGNAAIAANAAKAASGSALSRIGAIAAALAGLAASVGVLKFTESRFDAVERVTDALGKDINRVLQTLGVVNGRATTAQSTADKALKQAEKADDKAFDAQQKAGIANNTANQAKSIAQSAQTEALQATKEAKEGKNLAQKAIEAIGLIFPQLGAIQSQLNRIEKIRTTTTVVNRNINNNSTVQGFTEFMQSINGVNSRLDKLAGLAVPIGAIQNRVNSLPNTEQVKQAAQQGSCQSLNSPSCTANLKEGINQSINQANNNLSNKIGNLINGANLGANAAQMQVLNTINTKLGAQVPGGLSGAFGRLFKFLQIDRILNLLTTATTIHNAAMLSNNLGQTLGQAVGNIFALIGIKDENGSPFDVGQVINGTVENLLKKVIGEANYIALNATWVQANRIYQAGINAINSFQNLSNTILNGIEITAGRIGKVANALNKARTVLEGSYEWMNPQPKFNNILQRFENLDNAANTVLQISQVPLDVLQAKTELVNATTELTKALKEDDSPGNKGIADIPPQQLSNEQQISKNISQGILTTVDDWFDGSN